MLRDDVLDILFTTPAQKLFLADDDDEYCVTEIFSKNGLIFLETFSAGEAMSPQLAVLILLLLDNVEVVLAPPKQLYGERPDVHYKLGSDVYQDSSRVAFGRADNTRVFMNAWRQEDCLDMDARQQARLCRIINQRRISFEYDEKLGHRVLKYDSPGDHA